MDEMVKAIKRLEHALINEVALSARLSARGGSGAPYEPITEEEFKKAELLLLGDDPTTGATALGYSRKIMAGLRG